VGLREPAEEHDRRQLGHDPAVPAHAGGHRLGRVKLIVVLISGVTAALHARARSPAGLAVFGALTAVSALAALFLGVLLAG
jgi:hypothetical protein